MLSPRAERILLTRLASGHRHGVRALAFKHAPHTDSTLWSSVSIRRSMVCAFDLLELDGKDLRRKPIEMRKSLLAELLKGSHLSLVFNECFEEDGPIVFREACGLGCGGIVSKRLGSIYRRGRSPLLAQGQKRASGEARGRTSLCRDNLSSNP
jgi:hypothetical protein